MGEDNPVDATQTKRATFKINDTRLYVPVVTLPINDKTKFLENIKQGIKRTFSWNKYRSEITTQPENSNLDYMIDPTFKNPHSKILTMSILTRDYYDKYYMLLVEINEFNVLVGNKPFNKKRMKSLPKYQEEIIILQKTC